MVKKFVFSQFASNEIRKIKIKDKYFSESLCYKSKKEGTK